MTTYTLTLIDVRRVQNYLFNANELRQNLGASLLVEQATHEWIIKCLPEKHNLEWEPASYRLKFKEKTIEGDDLDAEVIFMGGGNAAILFSSLPNAVAFTQRYTRHVLLNAPGLEVAVGHTEVDWGQEDGLKTAWEKMQTEITPARKEGRAVSQMLPGISVTAECAFTGLPAIEDMRKLPDRTDPLVLVSAEVRAKREPKTIETAKARLNKLLPAQKPFAYTDDLEKLGGEKGRSRFIAVVHADGNEMGRRVNGILKNISGNRERVEEWRKLSNKINDSGLKAMEAVTDWLRNAIRLDEETGGYMLKDQWGGDAIRYREDEDDDVIYLPIRPIVFGGDDITFVCEGRLGIAMAIRFLEAFYAQNSLRDGKLYACAGVAIVHHNYPFARAYKLAEDLCKEAKRQAREYDDPKKQASLIHWHISTSGLTLDWDDIHRREYQVDAGDLLLRPLIVNKADKVTAMEKGWRTWKVFEHQVKEFRQGDAWKGRRSKLKELRETLRQGPFAVQEFTRVQGSLPKVIDNPEPDTTGWYGTRCVYFDALDTDDWLIYPQDGKEDTPDA